MFTLPLNALAKSGEFNGQLEIPSQDLGLSQAFLPQTVAVSLRVESLDEGFLARGTVKALAEQECSRCLESFKLKVEAPFTVQFELHDEKKGEKADPEDEAEGHVWFSGDALPLGEQLRQELELALPFKPVCDSDCPGLCDQCGLPLKAGACHCEEKPNQSPFSGLGQLIKPEEE